MITSETFCEKRLEYNNLIVKGSGSMTTYVLISSTFAVISFDRKPLGY